MINKYKQLIYLYKIYYEKTLKNNTFNKLYIIHMQYVSHNILPTNIRFFFLYLDFAKLI